MRAWLCLLAWLPLAAQTPVRRDAVIVTGAFEPIPLEEADRPVTVFDARALAPLANTWVDMLRLDPSLDLRQRAPGGVQSDLSINGASFGQTLVLLNGVRLNDAQSGHHNLDVPVPLESVSGIEILRGSGSALYGSDAVGGVVNFITRPPEATEVRLRAAAGSFGVNQQRVSVAAVTGAFAQQFAASRDFSSGFLPNRDYRNLSLASTTHWRATHIDAAHTDRPFGADGFYGDYRSWERTRTWFTSVRQGFGANTAASFAYRRHTDLFVLHRDRPEVFTNRHATESFQAALRRRRRFAGATLHYGAEGLRESIASNNLGRHGRTRGAAYAALDLRAVRRFSFTVGAREEVYGGSRRQFSPTAGAGMWLSPRLKLRAGLSHAFRLPSFTDLYYHDPANLGSPDLRPERAWGAEAGLDWNPGAKWRGDVTVFQRRERDGIDYSRRSAAGLWRAANIQRLRFTGAAATLAIPHGLEFRYARLHGSGGPPAGVLSRYAFNYAEHSGVFAWQGPLPRGMAGRTRVGVTQRRGQTPYALWDVYVARGRGAWRPFAQATNLGNTSYEEVAGVRMPGRAVLGGVEWVLPSARR